VLTREQQELLTFTGPGTAGGEMLRRYWQPAAIATEIPAGGPPMPVRLLGEDLVLFRDDEGRPGLLGLHCAHRGCDLSYGRLEDGGLRCVYHGWLYDVNGDCLEQPGEPAGSTFYQQIHHKSYPCREAGGIILAYLGTGEPPLVPEYDFLTAPDDRRTNVKVLRECNFLQGLEGTFDSVHLGFLHWQKPDPKWMPNPAFDLIDLEPTNFGLRNFWIRYPNPEKQFVHVTSFIMPNIGIFGGPRGQGYSCNWHVPIDDTHHWGYSVSFSYDVRVGDDRGNAAMSFQKEVGPDYKPFRNLGNRYLQDRDEQRTRTFLGMGPGFYAHDGVAIESAGVIQDRSEEHLAVGDKVIVAERLMLLKAIAEVQAGRDPQGVIREPSDNAFMIVGGAEEIDRKADHRAHWVNGLREEVGTGFKVRV
jgi:phthalate 4,5-dioxygenase oxygenase subunit